MDDFGTITYFTPSTLSTVTFRASHDCTRGKLRSARAVDASCVGSATSVVALFPPISAIPPFITSAQNRECASRARPLGNERSSITTISPLFAFPERETNNALRRMRLFIFWSYTRSVRGPCVTPPPIHKGDRMDPCRALPVPVCSRARLLPLVLLVRHSMATQKHYRAVAPFRSFLRSHCTHSFP